MITESSGSRVKILIKEVLAKIAVGLAPLKVYGEKLRRYLTEELTVKQSVIDEEFKTYSLVTLVERARQEWEQTKIIFNEVKDPELIDHTIYAMEAAERKYMYLLKEAKREKVVNNKYLLHTEQ
jgi:hypothetical protein